LFDFVVHCSLLLCNYSTTIKLLYCMC